MLPPSASGNHCRPGLLSPDGEDFVAQPTTTRPTKLGSPSPAGRSGNSPPARCSPDAAVLEDRRVRCRAVPRSHDRCCAEGMLRSRAALSLLSVLRPQAGGVKQSGTGSRGTTRNVRDERRDRDVASREGTRHDGRDRRTRATLTLAGSPRSGGRRTSPERAAIARSTTAYRPVPPIPRRGHHRPAGP